MRKFGLIFFGFFILLPSTALAAGVMINEIAWMGTSVSTADEWLELRNETSSAVDIAGWRLEWRGGEYGITFGLEKCTNTTIAAGGYFLLERTDDSTVPGITADCIYTGALRNNPDGEHLKLIDASGNVIDQINALGGWPAGDNTTKDTMQRVGSSWVPAAPTPRAANAGASPPPPPPASSSGPQTQSQTPSPSMSAYAGEDRTATAGAPVEFLGTAVGLKGEPITQARFWWNFGDGETTEGRSVAHTFRIPASYTVGLHVSSGEHAASDYLTVTAVPNQLAVSSVLVGEEGYLKVRNPSKFVLELGGWVIRDAAGKEFSVPAKTVIGSGAEVAFANRVTGLLVRPGSLPLTVYYPNRTKAFEWSGGGSTTAVSRRATSSPTKERGPAESVLSPVVPEERGTTSSLAATHAASPSVSLFFWIALALSAAASAGFLLVRKFSP